MEGDIYQELFGNGLEKFIQEFKKCLEGKSHVMQQQGLITSDDESPEKKYVVVTMGGRSISVVYVLSAADNMSTLEIVNISSVTKPS